MRRMFPLLILNICVLVFSVQGQQAAPVQNQRSYLEVPYSSLVPFQDEQQALTLSLGNSSYYQNLTNLWSTEDAVGLGKSTASAGRDTSALAVGFELPEAWKGRQTFICFSVLKTSIMLLVNGEYVETLKAKLPAKLNITSFLQHDENLIEIRTLDGKVKQGFNDIADSAYVFSGASKHEKNIEIFGNPGDQDPLRGIQRVNIKILVRDYAQAPWDIHDLNYYIKLYDHLGSEVVNYNSEREKRRYKLPSGGESFWTYSTPVTGMKMWSAESPYRHTVTLVTKDRSPAEEIQEVYAQKVGLRQVYVKDDKLYLNHTLIKLDPVLYELPSSNATVPNSHFEELVKELKQHNVNMLVVSGDPLPYTRLYELCDQYGLYVVQCLDLGLGQSVDERTMAALHALKNYSSLIGWYIPAEGETKALPAALSKEIADVTYYTPILQDNYFHHLSRASRWNKLPAQKKLDLKQIYQRVLFLPEPGEEGRSTVKVVNKYNFIPLENMLLEWQVQEKGVMVKEGRIKDITVDAKGNQSFPLPFDLKEFADNPRYSFSFSLKNQERTPWAEAGHELAKEYFVFAEDDKGAFFLKRTIFPSQEPR